MDDALHSVRTGSITYAVRSSSVDGLDLNAGDIIGLDERKILTKGTQVDEVAVDLVKKIIKPNHETITLFYGEDITEESATALCDRLAELYPDRDVDVHRGGQPLYHYIISIE